MSGKFILGVWVEGITSPHPWIPGSPVLSTGEPSNLKTWYAIAKAVGGPRMIKMFEDKVAEQGEDEIVCSDEGQLLNAIIHGG
jgi:hypothetical protein